MNNNDTNDITGQIIDALAQPMTKRVAAVRTLIDNCTREAYQRGAAEGQQQVNLIKPKEE